MLARFTRLTRLTRLTLTPRKQADRFKQPAHATRSTILHSVILALLIDNDLIFLEKKI